MGHSHNVQQADQTGQSEEIGIRLDQHPLNLVELSHRGTPLLLRGFLKAVRHGSKDLELPV